MKSDAQIGLADRLNEVVQRFDTKAELARQAGIKPTTLNSWLKGRFQPRTTEAAAIARAAGVSVAWLVAGEGEPDDRPAAGLDEASAPDGQALDGGDFLFLPRYEVRAAAGGGRAVHSEQIVDFLAFRRDWVRGELGLDPRDLLLIEAHGDSMEPTLSSGDLLLIHTAEPRVRDNAVYAIGVDGDLVVKRVQRRLDGTLVIRSDNPTYESEEVPAERADELRVIGRVVWVGRRM